MITVQHAVDEFVLSCRADQLAKATIAWYRSILTTFAKPISDTPLGNITPHDIRSHIASIALSKATINAHNRALHKFWAWCESEYGIVNPMGKIKYPKPPKNQVPKAITPHDMRVLFDACQDDAAGYRNRAIMAFLADTGCRAAGVCGLTLDNLDLKTRRALVCEKGLKVRKVCFTAFTAHLIQTWLDQRPLPSRFVFTSLKSDTGLTPNGLLNIFNRLKADTGVIGKVNPHSWRHGFAREYLNAGGDLAKLGALLGHASMDVTAAHYAIFTLDELDSDHEQKSMVRFLNG